MSVLTPVIDHIDGQSRRIYLKQGVSDFYPIEDIYHEYRYLRRTDEARRVWEPLLKAEGNIPKGAGAFTPRYVVLLDGTKIVPYNETIQLNQLGDMITDDPDTDATLYDVSQLTVPKPIFIKPSEAEVIQLNSESIVFSSFLGGVWVDMYSQYDDIGSAAEPNGNRERPVNNIQLAVQIAQTRGFDTIFILGDITLSTGDNIEGFTLVGQNATRSHIVIEDDAWTQDCEFTNFSITGVLDGGSSIVECNIGNLNYINGYIYSSVLTEANIQLGGGSDAIFLDCWSGVAGSNTPTIDMGGSGQKLAVRGYSGGLKIVNRTGTDATSIDFTSGQFIADSTVTNGTIIVRGNVGKITDNSTGSAIIDISGVTNTNTISTAVWEYPDRDLTSTDMEVDNLAIAKAVWDYELPTFPDPTLYPQGR